MRNQAPILLRMGAQLGSSHKEDKNDRQVRPKRGKEALTGQKWLLAALVTGNFAVLQDSSFPFAGMAWQAIVAMIVGLVPSGVLTGWLYFRIKSHLIALKGCKGQPTQRDVEPSLQEKRR